MAKQERPSVLFICVSNAGKSQMAEALMRARVGDSVSIHSAGTHPKGSINKEAAESVARVGASMDGAISQPVDDHLLRTVDRVIILGNDAEVDPPFEMKAEEIERWDTVEPSADGVEGDERLDLIRDDIAQRVDELATEMGY